MLSLQDGEIEQINMLMSLFYNLIYNRNINFFLRNTSKVFVKIIPEKYQIYPSGQITVKVENKQIKIRTNQTSYLTRELFWKGTSYFEYTDIFIPLVQKISTFIDVGANIGYYSLLGARLNEKLKVIAFEPSEGPFIYFLENLKINSLLDRVDVETFALSDVDDTIDFYVIENSKYPTIYNLSGEHNTGAKKNSHACSKIKVPSKKLDSYFKQIKIDKIDLIKLDTEGSEHLILSGASETIKRYRPIIICEILFNVIEQDIMSFFYDKDYLYFNHTKMGLTRVHQIVRSQDDGVRNCFIVPQEKVSLIEEFIVS